MSEGVQDRTIRCLVKMAMTSGGVEFLSNVKAEIVEKQIQAARMKDEMLVFDSIPGNDLNKPVDRVMIDAKTITAVNITPVEIGGIKVVAGGTLDRLDTMVRGKQ